MLAEHIRYRAALYAAIYAPPVKLTRDQATTLYKRLANEIFPNLQLQYVPETETQPFRISMKEADGPRVDTVIVDVQPTSALRLLVRQDWPDAFAIACKKADTVREVFDDTVQQAPIEAQIELTEARIRADVPVGGDSAQKYLMARMMGEREHAPIGSGQLAHWGIHFEVRPSEPASEESVAGPCRDVTVEPLRDDPTKLYLEVMSNWGRKAIRPHREKKGQLELVSGPLDVSGAVPQPSAHMEEVRSYIEKELCPFLEEGQ